LASGRGYPKGAAFAPTSEEKKLPSEAFCPPTAQKGLPSWATMGREKARSFQGREFLFVASRLSRNQPPEGELAPFPTGLPNQNAILLSGVREGWSWSVGPIPG